MVPHSHDLMLAAFNNGGYMLGPARQRGGLFDAIQRQIVTSWRAALVPDVTKNRFDHMRQDLGGFRALRSRSGGENRAPSNAALAPPGRAARLLDAAIQIELAFA